MQNFKLNLSQVQKLILTQELRQSIELLAINVTDLNMIINEMAEENPLIEIDKPEELSMDEAASLAEEKSKLLDLADRFDYPTSSQDFSHREEKDSPLDYLGQTSSSYEDLVFQFRHINSSDQDRKILKLILSSLNSRCYLSLPVEEIAKLGPYKEEDVERVRQVLLDLDPRGIGSKDLREFLSLQAEDDKILLAIIEDHLEDLANNRIGKIAKDLGLSIDKAAKKADEIRAMDPIPCHDLMGDSPTSYLYPEAEIIKEDGQYLVNIINDYRPKVLISAQYKNMIKEADKETLDYLKDKLNSAQWLVDSLDQRESSIKIILTELIKIQRDFLDKGPGYLRPLSQKDLAQATGLSESTISRVVNDKYVSTPQGLMEIKDFFTGGGRGGSTDSIQERIKEIINEEDKKKPLSDSKIEALLKEEGSSISRRTVAKYREELGIPSSTKRKVY